MVFFCVYDLFLKNVLYNYFYTIFINYSYKRFYKLFL